MCGMSADAWSALGTWVGGGATVWTLWYMRGQIVQQNKQIEEDKKQYETDRNDRLKSEELDGDYEMLQYLISAIEKSTSKFIMSDEDIDEISNSPEHLKRYMKGFVSLQNEIEGLQRQCENFKVRHLTKGMILEMQLNFSTAFAMVLFFNEHSSSPHDMNKLCRVLHQKK